MRKIKEQKEIIDIEFIERILILKMIKTLLTLEVGCTRRRQEHITKFNLDEGLQKEDEKFFFAKKVTEE